MTKMRLLMLAASGVCLASGLTAGALIALSGSIDQAVAFTWPGLGAAIAFGLITPGETAGD
ncbi:MAG: hypothetical protein ABL308_01810 [Oceanicaulis sp.]